MAKTYRWYGLSLPLEQAILGTWKLTKKEGKVGGKFTESVVGESYEVYDANGDYKNTPIFAPYMLLCFRCFFTTRQEVTILYCLSYPR